jgi:hypothetical protein
MDKGQAHGNTMTFTTGETITFGSTVEMAAWSGISMLFGTNITIQFIDLDGNGVLETCDWIHVVLPPMFYLDYCSWWEILDSNGNPTGYEFHVDDYNGDDAFHIEVFPGPIQVPPGMILTAVKKVDIIEPCRYFTVHEPQHWYPPVCSWWEIIDPETRLPTGHEFHVDWNNESCEFHVDKVTPGPYYLPFPYYEVEARQKIVEIQSCTWLTVESPVGFITDLCDWWEILAPDTGTPTGFEFHVDRSIMGGRFHIDVTHPTVIELPWGPSYTILARKKIDILQQCGWFKVNNITATPEPCTWWKIIQPDIGDVEFHVDIVYASNGTFHVDYLMPFTDLNPPLPELVAEKKFVDIGPCDWFEVIDPPGWLPTPCTYWRITWPTEWAGVTFHVDANNGINKFHIDSADTLPAGPTPPPWNVTAEEFNPWYYKPSYVDYALSGMPDFDERQMGTYNWSYQGAWSHCGPVAVANSLWWLDSEFEPHPVLPPTINDGFTLVSAFGQWDDHATQNVVPLVEKLAWFMDTDGRLTHLLHKGTSAADMQAGLTHYLSWSGVNPQGDVDGDGNVTATDANLVALAFGSVPGAGNWNMAADLNQDNSVGMVDAGIVAAHMGQTGLFYEHTVNQPEFDYIEQEVERCQDVVLSIGYYVWTAGHWYREDGHFVTVAGVDSEDFKIAISDPIRDAFENHLIAEGRIPIPHVHGPEPPYTTHNDAAYVSQDIYTVVPAPPQPAGLPGKWMLMNFPPEAQGQFIAVIEDAVITSPQAVPDVAVIDITTSKSGCYPMCTVGRTYNAQINVTVQNQGSTPATFNVKAYVNATLIGTQTVTNLPPSATTILTFTWNTTGYAIDTYTITASADILPGETDTADNTLTDDEILKVTIIGDINGDDMVEMMDFYYASNAYNSKPGDLNWCPNADIYSWPDGDKLIEMMDFWVLSENYLHHYP